MNVRDHVNEKVGGGRGGGSKLNDVHAIHIQMSLDIEENPVSFGFDL